MTAQELASRVMKARHESICLICYRLIKPGDLIAKTGAWVHARCAIDRQHHDSTKETA